MERGTRGVKGEMPYPATTRGKFYLAVMNSSLQTSTRDTFRTQHIPDIAAVVSIGDPHRRTSLAGGQGAGERPADWLEASWTWMP